MNVRLLSGLRIIVTLAMVALALWAAFAMWRHYEVDPWTRDGKVRADVVRVASDVPGLVTQVLVEENQHVAKGTPLFVVDRPRYSLASQQAQASVASARAVLAEARQEYARNVALGDLVSVEEREKSRARLESAQSALAAARAAADIAALNLRRTVVAATVDGYVANLQLHPGDYVTAGNQAMALVDAHSLRVDGYFEETKLPLIHIGDPVEVSLMGERQPLKGKVASIAPGIDDRDRANSGNQLASVTPTFNWVRLAQRVPVRVELTEVPNGIALIAGRTATVTILPHGAQRAQGAGDGKGLVL